MTTESATSAVLTRDQHKAQQELRAILDRMGVTVGERAMLYALAWCESDFRWDVSGDEGKSWGMFQAEREPGASPEVQTQNAAARVRRAVEELAAASAINDRAAAAEPSVLAVATRSVADRTKLIRASWQLPEGWLTKWITACGAIVAMLEQAAAGEKAATAGGNPAAAASSAAQKAAAMGMLNKGEGLGVDAFIGWLGGQGAAIDTKALKAGQAALAARMGTGNVDWNVIPFFDGGFGPSAGSHSNIFGWGLDQLKSFGGGALDMGSSLASGASAAVQGAGSLFSAVLPVGGLILGGGLALYLLHRLFGKGR